MSEYSVDNVSDNENFRVLNIIYVLFEDLTLVNVERKISVEQLYVFQSSACNLGFGTGTLVPLVGKICLFCSKSIASPP